MQDSASLCPIQPKGPSSEFADSSSECNDHRREPERGPIFWNDQSKFWVVTGYAETLALLKDDRLSVNTFPFDISSLPENMQLLEWPLRVSFRMLALLDQADHSRIRGSVAKAFIGRTLEMKRGQIQQLASQYLEPLTKHNRINVLEDIALPLSANLFAFLFGAPQEDLHLLTQWAEELIVKLAEIGYSLLTETKSNPHTTELECDSSFAQNFTACLEYFQQMIKASGDIARQDWLQAIVDATKRGDLYTEDEALGLCLQLLDASIFTTAHMISNSLYVLLNHPAQLQLLRANPALMQQAINELLRYDSLVPKIYRCALTDIDFHGHQIAAGEIIVFHLDEVNRDPAQFSDPDLLNLLRTENRHVSLGYGPHYCLGAHLIRLEMEIILPLLVQYFHTAKIEVTEWKKGGGVCGFQNFVITLGDQEPIVWDDQMKYWIVSGYTEMMALLKDERFSSHVFLYDLSLLPEHMQSHLKEPLQILSQMLSFLDRPDHDRLRRLLTKEFSLRTLQKKRQQIQQMVRQHFELLFESGDINALEESVYPLAVSIFMHLFGIPQEDHPLFMQWTRDLHHFMYPLYPQFHQFAMSDPEALKEIVSLAQRVTACIAYFRQLIRAREDSYREDWLQALLNARKQGDFYSEDEMLAMCMQLLDGGVLTTTLKIGDSFAALLRHPDQIQLLHAHPELLPQAINELLRYDDTLGAPVYRRVLTDMDFCGHQMKAGELIVARLGAANYDPTRFAEPDRLDIQRTQQRHLSLGYGSHYCLGAYLTQLEMEIVLPLFVDFFITRKPAS